MAIKTEASQWMINFILTEGVQYVSKKNLQTLILIKSLPEVE
jgi:hypothetical protein